MKHPARLAAAAITLREQLDQRFPKRDKRSDGWIGDQAHSIRVSDHNPDPSGWVRALDIDEDFGSPGDAERFADQLIEYCRSGQDLSRIKNIVYENRVASGTFPDRPGRPPTYWVWRRDNTLGHTNHIHISFTKNADLDGRPFRLPILKQQAEPEAPKAPAKKTPAKKTAKKKTST